MAQNCRYRTVDTALTTHRPAHSRLDAISGGSRASAVLESGHVPSQVDASGATAPSVTRSGPGDRTRHDEQDRVIVNIVAGFRSGSRRARGW